MFAAAFWNEDERRLVVVRDRVGIKPLYVCRLGNDIYFGSELKTILFHPEIPRRLDLSALHHYLALNYVPGPFTLIEGIQKLRPGPSKSYRWEGRTLRCSTYANWSAAYSNCRRTPSWLSPGFVRTTIEGEAESPNPSCTDRKSPSSLLPAIPSLGAGTYSAPLNRLRWNRAPSDLLITGVSSLNRHSVPGSPLAPQWGQMSKFLNTNGEYSR